MNPFSPAAFTFAQSAPGANTDIFGTEITPNYVHSVLRIAVSLAGASVFNLIVTQGATLKTIHLNAGAALVASAGYVFTWPIRKAEGSTTLTYNFQVETNVAIDWLSVEEVPGGLI